MDNTNYIMTLVNRFRQNKSIKETNDSLSNASNDSVESYVPAISNTELHTCKIVESKSVTETAKSDSHESFANVSLSNASNDSNVSLSNASNDSVQITEEELLKELKPQMRLAIKVHQIEGIVFMLRNISAGRGCILAHSMGLGKTMQVIGLCDLFLGNSSQTILILMPVNTIRHFLAEFDYWLPLQPHKNFIARKFNVYTISDSQRSLQERCKTFSQWSLDGGVLILGYEMFRSFISQNRGRKRPRNLEEEEQVMHHTIKSSLVSSNLVVCDEGHRIKHMDTQTFLALQQLDTKLRLVVTGYPLQNNLNEYYTLIDYVVPKFLGSETEFKILFEKPIIMGQFSDSSPEEKKIMQYRTHVLQTLLVPLVHRRCEKLLRDTLPQKFESTLFFKMTPIQRELYKKVLEVTTNNPVNAFSIVCKIMNDPNILFDYLQNDEATETDIEGNEDMEIGKLYFKELHSIMEAYVPKLIDTSPKMIVLFHIIEWMSQLNEKLIIFSQSLSTLNMIETCLQTKLKWKRNLHFYRIDGSVSQLSRQNMVVKFNKNSESKIFLLSTKTGCLGISLVAANRVVLVLFDSSFNPSDDLQAIGRVYRYGQNRNTFIYKFVMDNSLEKSIFKHQIPKQQISKRMVDTQNPEPYMSSKVALSSYFKFEENDENKECSPHLCDYFDSVLNNIVTNCSMLLTEAPLLHESLPIDNEAYKLLKSESLLGFKDYRAAKRALSSDSSINDSSSSISSESEQASCVSSFDSTNGDNSDSLVTTT